MQTHTLRQRDTQAHAHTVNPQAHALAIARMHAHARTRSRAHPHTHTGFQRTSLLAPWVLCVPDLSLPPAPPSVFGFRQEQGQPAAELLCLAISCALSSLRIARGRSHPICTALDEMLNSNREHRERQMQTESPERARREHTERATESARDDVTAIRAVDETPNVPEALEQVFSEFRQTGWRRWECAERLARTAKRERARHGQPESQRAPQRERDTAGKEHASSKRPRR